MARETCSLLTVVAESVLEKQLVADLAKLGVTGFTVTDARGGGHHGRRDSGWDHTGNIRIEVLCDPGLAERLARHFEESYAGNFAMTLWLQDARR
jgi:hypothetical protein